MNIGTAAGQTGRGQPGTALLGSRPETRQWRLRGDRDTPKEQPGHCDITVGLPALKGQPQLISGPESRSQGRAREISPPASW